MRKLPYLLGAAVFCVSAYLIACESSTAAPALPAAVTTLKSSMAPYASFALAKTAGYSTPITDCMSNGDAGAMGTHFANVALIDSVADAMHPEALIYEPGTNGEMSLVGVEYIIPFSVRPKTSAAPTLFGEKYMVNNVFQVWALHVWTHRSNPNGLYAAWNPRVHC